MHTLRRSMDSRTDRLYRHIPSGLNHTMNSKGNQTEERMQDNSLLRTSRRTFLELSGGECRERRHSRTNYRNRVRPRTNPRPPYVSSRSYPIRGKPRADPRTDDDPLRISHTGDRIRRTVHRTRGAVRWLTVLRTPERDVELSVFRTSLRPSRVVRWDRRLGRDHGSPPLADRGVRRARLHELAANVGGIRSRPRMGTLSGRGGHGRRSGRRRRRS